MLSGHYYTFAERFYAFGGRQTILPVRFFLKGVPSLLEGGCGEEAHDLTRVLVHSGTAGAGHYYVFAFITRWTGTVTRSPNAT